MVARSNESNSPLLEYICLDGFVLENDDEREISRELIGLSDMYLLQGLRVQCSWQG